MEKEKGLSGRDELPLVRRCGDRTDDDQIQIADERELVPTGSMIAVRGGRPEYRIPCVERRQASRCRIRALTCRTD
jgi:hypothetical protein